MPSTHANTTATETQVSGPDAEKGFLFDIQRFALHDGPGIRTTIFFKGCGLRCWWCHNPESQLPVCETVEKELRFDGHTLAEEELIGRWWTAEDVLEVVERDRVFYEESGGGLTCSGGEPLLQPLFLKKVLTMAGERRIHRALDTCGNVPRRSLEAILNDVELFLYDLKLTDEEEHLRYTGTSNRLLLENLRFLAGKGRNVIIRFPVVPGITDTEHNIDGILHFLQSISAFRKIDLLPYHAIGKHKYHRLRRQNPLDHLQPPTEEQLQRIKRRLEYEGLTVRIGG